MTQQDPEGEEALSSPRQIDVLPELASLPVLDGSGHAVEVDCPNGVAVVTQCCDLARGGKGRAHLAPIQILDGDAVREARSGRSPQYVAVPELGEDYFADLGTIASADHAIFNTFERQSGVKDEVTRHELRQRVGRKFSRFPLPDQIVPMFRVLQQKVRDRAGNEASNFGRVLDLLSTLRVEAIEGWDAEPPWTLRLLMVVETGILPTSDEPTSYGSASSAPGKIDAVSSRILRAPLGTDEMAQAWDELARAVEIDVQRKAPGPSILSEFDIEVLDEEELSYARFRRTVSLDLDDLSPADLY